jgi:hypothetical protein
MEKREVKRYGIKIRKSGQNIGKNCKMIAIIILILIIPIQILIEKPLITA